MSAPASAAPSPAGTAAGPGTAAVPGTAALRVRGLRKAYGAHQAVDGIDLDIARGEVLALLGPNGAGKTTTVDILSGAGTRDAGEVDVLGFDPALAARGARGRAWRARLGIVAQSTALIPELTVAELVSHVAGFYPAPRDPDEIISLTGLAEKRNARARALSGGQARRLDVACAVVGGPELLFLDEPTTGFDPEARRQFWDLIRQLKATGTTILLTTHYLDEAEALADRIAVVKAGRIVAGGTPGELRGRAHGGAAVSWDSPQGRQTRHTDTPARLVTMLASSALSTSDNGEVPGLTVTRPTLEDVYLQLIGGTP